MKLKKLDIANNKISFDNKTNFIEFLDNLSSFVELKELNVSANRFMTNHDRVKKLDDIDVREVMVRKFADKLDMLNGFTIA